MLPDTSVYQRYGSYVNTTSLIDVYFIASSIHLHIVFAQIYRDMWEYNGTSLDASVSLASTSQFLTITG